MDYAIDFDVGHEIARLCFHGTVTESSFLAGTEAGREFIRRNRAKVVIIDFTDARRLEFGAAFLRQYAASTITVLPTGSRIIVAAQDSIYGLMRMFEVHRDPDAPVSSVVRTRQEAYRLAGAENPDFKVIPK